MVQYSRSANLDAVLAAVSDPTRRAIVDRLARGPSTISSVAERFPMSLTGFCKHVRVLERAGLVHRKRHGRENTLELLPAPLHDVAQWAFSYSRFWNSQLDRIEEHFIAKKEKH
jgi:DNA-binding transcriptional ArsR family regulator